MKTGKRGIAIITAAALAIMWLLPSWRTQAAEAVPGIPAEAVPGIPSGADNTTGMLLGAVAAGAMQAEGTEQFRRCLDPPESIMSTSSLKIRQTTGPLPRYSVIRTLRMVFMRDG